ncbi:hypothetical protein ColTof4_05538 [Colletotrichum tofieldiae]|uniref:Vacuolar ATPase assembly protein VMA22 n=1 Tax=Colletotrichum tofieldiae TaxID=708197 RepID=A0A166N7R9_9PEZI|nr:hypothetical protein CT0861_00251 [Colletotrichum tofieldiae]GKT53359.1 hypothetical protein ColTof3_00698 [Colletotrichum tofieldiae]GKT73115.1 hypothetical protein ColTof4_05538 [Colletotrichum tofieldiae]GKT88217.1 hypothetical protein Ct61P_06067 [Colletotrichum tofieldiae]
METDHIDTLLERYLVLLDEYTILRERLGKAQAGMYQNIARANFSAERGVRYGPDYYDERMRALRILDIAADGRGVPRFEIVKPADAVTVPKAAEAEAEAEAETREARGQKCEGQAPGDTGEAPRDGAEETTSSDEVKGEMKAGEERTKKQKKSNDPLRWFGILAPLPLRQAQTLSVQAVQDIIPRLVSVDAEMKDVEIEVRRARKRRAKSEAAALKKSDTEEVLETDHHDTRAPVAAVEST